MSTAVTLCHLTATLPPLLFAELLYTVSMCVCVCVVYNICVHEGLVSWVWQCACINIVCSPLHGEMHV